MLSTHRWSPTINSATRFQSTEAGGAGARPSLSSSVAADAAGGGLALLGVYAFYHFPEVKEALNFLRSAAQSYLIIIPGAHPHIKAVLDTIDDLHNSHRDELNRIVGDVYDEVNVIVKDSPSVDMGTAMKILDVLCKRSVELEELGKKAGSDALSSLSSKYPQLMGKLGSGYAELKKLAKSNPEAKKLCGETTKEIHEIFSEGFSQESVSRAQDLIQSKTTEIRKMAKSYSEQAPPEVKQILSDNADNFIASTAMTLGQGRGGLEEVFGKIKDAANGDITKDKAKMREIVEYVRAKAHEAEEQGGWPPERGSEGLRTWVRPMPGGEDALKHVPGVKVLVKLSCEHGEDAKKLAKETYDDLTKDLSQKAKDDVKEH
ncbi:uncharacterized protein BXZ73DRAFT_87954 [Epithele typhae]|uniref:uncharacterized protein n=1 Tax=Epithele typhae TaxID=378194 RepID=UPI0020088CA4|nr:uncharacterized protein BXZ73DRAFT_87954 [Epithele typhae]KAH9942341.1 hypothetical protein BXZ73DRAFT_87954 [Epithele typhae]